MNTFSSTPPPTEGQRFFGQLPILDKILDAYKLWQNFLPNLPRISRYTIATKIDSLFLDLLELTLTALYSQKINKIKILEKAAQKLDLLKFFFRVGWEIKAINNKKYISISKALAEIGKMLGGWLKQIKNTPPE